MDKKTETKAETKAETTEIAVLLGGKDITRGYIDTLPFIDPQDSVLEHVGGFDYKLYEELSRDEQIKAVFSQRRLAVVSKEFNVIPGGNKRLDKKAADFITEMLNHIRWDTVTDKMLYSQFYGFAVAEALWVRDGANVMLDKLKVRNRKRFVFDIDFKPKLITTGNPNGEVLPDHKFWCLNTGADNDDEPYGLGLAHWLYWPVYFKRNQTKFWLIAQEKFGQPTVVGRYPAGTDKKDIQPLKDALNFVRTDSGIVIPENMAIELLEAARTGNMAYAEFYDRMNAAISKVVLGQTMTTDDGSSKSQAAVHFDVRKDIVDADARLIDDSFNRTIVCWLIDWNFPGAAYPRVTRDIEEVEKLNIRAQRDKVIVDMGFKLDRDYVESTYGVKLADEDTNVKDTNPDDFAEPEPTNILTESPFLKDGTRDQAGAATEVWLNIVREQVAQADTLYAVRAWLDNEAVDALSTITIANALGYAFTTALLAGRFDVETRYTGMAAYDSAPVYFQEQQSARGFFQEQIDFFRRKLNLPTATWTDIWQSQHDVGFVVAGAIRDELLSDFRAAVDSAIAEGTTLQTFRLRFDEIVAKHGWSYNGGRDWRSRVIYETNLRTSYAAGRWQQLQAVKKQRPYWQYRHSHASADPREHHLAWDGMVLHADDPWWHTNYPPNGWGCKCLVDALSASDLKRIGKDKPDTAPPLNRQERLVGRGPSARLAWVPEGVDPGFAYAPGRVSMTGDIARHRLQQGLPQPPKIAANGVAKMLSRPAAMEGITDDWQEWRKQEGHGSEAYSVGAVSTNVIEALQKQQGIIPQTAMITLSRSELAHLQRQSKQQRGAGLLDDDLDRLPEIINQPHAVLYDTKPKDKKAKHVLLYVFASGDEQKGKVVVEVDYTAQLKLEGSSRDQVTTNSIRTAGYVEAYNLKNPRYIVLDGEVEE